MGILLVDMSAAFNLVVKEVIVPKLKRLGIGEFAAKLLHSYLTSRKSKTKIKGAYSAWIEVKTGIGVGSVLGPLIFILTIVCCMVGFCRVAARLRSQHFTCDTSDTNADADVKLSSVKFADDVTGLTVFKTEDQVAISLEIMMEEYDKYFSAHGLKINVAKCEHIVMGARRTRKVVINGREEATEVKLLGLSFFNQYRFGKHVDNTAEKIARRNGQLSKLTSIADQDTMKMLANAVVMSTASYGVHVYASDVKHVNRIQVKLNKTMRMVMSSRLKVHVKDLLNMMDWMKFSEVVQLTKILLLSRIVKNSSAPYCVKLIKDAYTQSRYMVRDVELKIAWSPNLARRGCKSFLYTAVKLYNQVKIIGKKLSDDALSKFVKSTIKSWR